MRVLWVVVQQGKGFCWGVVMVWSYIHVCTLLSEEDDQGEDQGEMDPDLQLEDEGEDEVGSEAHWDEQYIGGVALVL